MSFEHKVLADDELVQVQAQGSLDFDSCVGALRTLADDPAFLPHYRVIADFRGVNYTPSAHDLRGFLDALKLVRRAFQNRTALVVDGWVHLTLARVACALGRLVSFEMAPFTSPEAALAWVNENRSVRAG